MFRTPLYSPLWYILKNKHIQNPTEYLRWSILLITLVTTAYLDTRYIRNIRSFKTQVCQLLLNPFHATGFFLYLLKASENLWFSDVFRGYRKRTVAWNGLMYQLFFRTPNLLLLLYLLLLYQKYDLLLGYSLFSDNLSNETQSSE